LAAPLEKPIDDASPFEKEVLFLLMGRLGSFDVNLALRDKIGCRGSVSF
jgi:hypothetical protein